MLLLDNIRKCEIEDVSYDVDYLASHDINLDLTYDFDKYGNLRNEVIYFRFNTPDNTRLLSFDIDRHYGFVLRIESPNLEFSLKNCDYLVPSNFEKGIPAFRLEGAEPDPETTSHNILDVTKNPSIGIYENGAVFKIGYSDEIGKVISPCEGIYFHFLNNDSLAEVSFITADRDALERFGKK